MHTALFASVIAFMVGMFAGHQATPAVAPTLPDAASEQTIAAIEMETPLATDFVTARPAVAALPAESLSDAEIADLTYMREEEKLAHDVYLTLYNQWGLRIFSNIAQSEETHTEAIYSLINKYGLTDPVTDDTVGVFTNPELAKLYTDLVQQGLASEIEALKVGALIEDLDIKDLDDAIARTDNADVALVYENLQRGSRNHLRSFTSQLSTRGVTYEPTYITAADYEAITSSDRETGADTGMGGMQGSGNGAGTGRGRGMGRQ